MAPCGEGVRPKTRAEAVLRVAGEGCAPRCLASWALPWSKRGGFDHMLQHRFICVIGGQFNEKRRIVGGFRD